MTAWLLTWLWQGLALTAVVAVAIRCAPKLNAATKHLIWCGVLVALLWLGWSSSPETAATALKGCATGLQPCLASARLEPIFYVPSAPDNFITTFVGIWMAIALVNLLRLLPGLHGLYALRDRCRPFPPEIEAELPLWLDVKQRGRRTELMICDAVPGATVLGLQRPCIAIPSTLAEALTADELDQVILHEHAHVQRRDDWSRLAQALLMSVLWIHPAALLVSRALNREREMACDEWVVACTGLPKAYARCLTRAAEVHNRIRGGSLLTPALFDRRHELVRRVDRLLTIKGKTRQKVSFVRAVAAMLAMAVISAHLQGVRFAEIADIVLPQVARPMLAAFNETKMVVEEMPIAIRPNGNAAPSGRVEPNAPVGPNAPVALGAPVAPGSAPIAPITITSSAPVAPSPIAPSIAPSVAFAGVYPVMDASASPSLDSPNRWSALGTPGVEIASAAKKTSIGIANVFSRAGVSLARSF